MPGRVSSPFPWIALLLGLFLAPGSVLGTDRGTGVVRFLGNPTFLATDSLPPLLLADIDEDGDLDAITSSRFLRTEIHINDGSGNLPLTISIDGVGPRAVGDVNADQHLDIIGGGAGGIGVVLLGDGSLNFTPHPEQLRVASVRALFDWDGDGMVDVFGWTGSMLFVDLGQGDGSFVAGGDEMADDTIRDLRFANLENDDTPDAIASVRESIFVFPEDGAGGFGPRRTVFHQDGIRVNGIDVGDLDEDGFADLAVAVRDPEGLLLLFGDGLGGFVQAPLIPASSSAEEVCVVDFDGDGHLDILLWLIGSYVRVHRGDGAGGFEVTGDFGILLPHGGETENLVVGDITGDGVPDVALRSNFRGTLPDYMVTLPGIGDGTLLANPVGTPLMVGFPGLQTTVPGDFIPGGDLEILLHGRTTRILLARGLDGVYDEHSRQGMSSTVHIVAGDFAGDGSLDLASLGLDEELRIETGFGTGAFALAGSTPLAHTVEARDRMAAGDFDEDGNLDLLVSSFLEHTVTVLLGDGAGSFEEADSIETLFRPNEVLVADFNRDGHVDFVISRFRGDNDFEPSRGTVFFGTGAGTFNGAQLLPVGGKMLLADLDGDGFDDLLNDEIFLGSAAGLFTGTGLESPPDRGLAADLDRDGNVDVVGWIDNRVLVHRGDGTGGLALDLDLPLDSDDNTIIAVHSIDMERDGQTDLVVMKKGTPAIPPLVWHILNRTYDNSCLDGNVNLVDGPPENVLFVNDSPGTGPLHTVFVDAFAPFAIRMETPPSRTGQLAPFALYAWTRRPTGHDARDLPFGIGRVCLPTPLDQPATGEGPVIVFNNLGYFGQLGAPDLPSSPASSLVVSRTGGTRRQGVFCLQGIIRDDASPQGQVATTNGVVVVSE